MRRGEGRGEGRGERRDEGSVLILTLGLVVVLVALLGVVVDVTALALRRREAELTADSAARAAAQAVDLSAYYRGAAGERIPLDVANARSQASEFLRRPWRMVRLTATDEVVQVTVASRMRLPFSGWLGIGQVRVVGRGAAEMRVAPR